jgi:hypothetical protein
MPKSLSESKISNDSMEGTQNVKVKEWEIYGRNLIQN